MNKEKIEQASLAFVNNLLKEILDEDKDDLYSAYEYSVLFDADEMRESFLKGAEWTLQDQWISVEDELPEKNKTVNVRLRDGRYTNSWVMFDGQWAYNVNPTHWMPIPQLPTENK